MIVCVSHTVNLTVRLCYLRSASWCWWADELETSGCSLEHFSLFYSPSSLSRAATFTSLWMHLLCPRPSHVRISLCLRNKKKWMATLQFAFHIKVFGILSSTVIKLRVLKERVPIRSQTESISQSGQGLTELSSSFPFYLSFHSFWLSLCFRLPSVFIFLSFSVHSFSLFLFLC